MLETLRIMFWAFTTVRREQYRTFSKNVKILKFLMKLARYLDKPAKLKEKWLKNWLAAGPKIFTLTDPKTGCV